MIKVLQFGEGVFLRSFVDAYFNELNIEGNNYGVTIVKPLAMGSLEKFKKQKNKYHIILRGVKDDNLLENVYKIECINSVIDPFIDIASFYDVAKDSDLKIIVSNTTEAGICFNSQDKFEDFNNSTYPAKLTKFLYQRFKSGLEGVYILPVELIDNNADELYKCVEKYITLWNLETEFKQWNDSKNFYCNTLVDRIVSGYPKDEQTKNHLTNLIGEKDELMSVCEPFGLWVIENKGDILKYIIEGSHNVDVILTSDIGYYKKRKVRVLNGSHTNLVPAGLWLGKKTVDECLQEENLKKFLNTTLTSEIIEFVSDDIKATAEFANSVIERFRNPFLNHQLESILLNSISKWRARNLPSFTDYYNKNNKIAQNLTAGFSYLIFLYSIIFKEGDKYFVKLPTRIIEIIDDKNILEYFYKGGNIAEFLCDEKIWGENLSYYKGFIETVESNIEKIKNGVEII